MKNLSARVDDALAEMLDRHCHVSGQTQTQAIIHALRHYLGSPEAAPVQHVLDTQMMIAQRLEAIEWLLKPSAKSAISRGAAPARVAPVTTPGSYQPEQLHALIDEWKQQRDEKGQLACWKDWASVVNDMGLLNKKGGRWTGDTLGHWYKRRAT
ncbi:hypothetical protein ACFA67_004547 [Salmonella enterica]